MSDEPKATQPNNNSPGRRGFFYTILGGLIAAFAGWISSAIPRLSEEAPVAPASPTPPDSRLSALEAEVARVGDALRQAGLAQPLGSLEGPSGERVVFNKNELTLANPEGVLLNLVATRGWVGFRFYKDFGFGNEQVDSPWSIFIEGVEGYQGLAFLRDWRFTAALWDEDGKLLLGRLHPHPPANDPARARLEVRGTLDEVQALIQASPDQAADTFQVIGKDGTTQLAVDGAGNLVAGSAREPTAVILHDTQDGRAHAVTVTNGQLSLAPA